MRCTWLSSKCLRQRGNHFPALWRSQCRIIVLNKSWSVCLVRCGIFNKMSNQITKRPLVLSSAAFTCLQNDIRWPNYNLCVVADIKDDEYLVIACQAKRSKDHSCVNKSITWTKRDDDFFLFCVSSTHASPFTAIFKYQLNRSDNDTPLRRTSDLNYNFLTKSWHNPGQD